MFFPHFRVKIIVEKVFPKIGFFPDFLWNFREKGVPNMYASAYVWAKVLAQLEERLDTLTVSSHFDDAEVVELNESRLHEVDIQVEGQQSIFTETGVMSWLT